MLHLVIVELSEVLHEDLAFLCINKRCETVQNKFIASDALNSTDDV